MRPSHTILAPLLILSGGVEFLNQFSFYWKSVCWPSLGHSLHVDSDGCTSLLRKLSEGCVTFTVIRERRSDR